MLVPTKTTKQKPFNQMLHIKLNSKKKPLTLTLFTHLSIFIPPTCAKYCFEKRRKEAQYIKLDWTMERHERTHQLYHVSLQLQKHRLYFKDGHSHDDVNHQFLKSTCWSFNFSLNVVWKLNFKPMLGFLELGVSIFTRVLKYQLTLIKVS